MAELYPMRSPHVKAHRLMAENVSTLLRARGQTQHDLAQWCHRSDVWVSQFLQGKRMWQLDDLDRIADFFGIATYQLFQPGIAPLTERRKAVNRRTGRERRVGHAQRLVLGLASSIEPYRSIDLRPTASTEIRDGSFDPQIEAEVRQLAKEFDTRIDALFSARDARRQAPTTRARLTATSRRRGSPSGSDPQKDG